MQYLIEVAKQSAKYIEEFKGSVFILKYGGVALSDQESMEHTLKDVARLFQQGILIVVVHGGGPMLSKRMKKENIPVEFKDGLRITTREAIKIISEVFGELNQKICNVLNAFSCSTQSIISDPCIKGDLIDAKNTENRVGRICSIETDQIDLTKIPVISPMAAFEDVNEQPASEFLNVNADHLSVELAEPLNARKVIFISDVNGILTDVDDPASMIDHIRESEVKKLVKEGIIYGGMEYKVRMALEALKRGVNKVHFINGLKSNSLMAEILTESGIGTEIVHDE